MEQNESNNLFKTGEVFDLPNDDLDEVLKKAAGFSIDNGGMHEILKVLIVNAIKSDRYIKSIQDKNEIYTIIIIFLTVISIALSVLTFFSSQEARVFLYFLI